MEIISSTDFEQLCRQDCLKVLKLGRGTEPKVYEKDNTIIKLFYPKKTRLSSNTIRPRALRFYRNCQRLLNKGHIAPKILAHQYCKEHRIHLVHYQKIDGLDIRYLAGQGRLDILDGVAKLMAHLHHQGIYIRSIHLENLLYQENGQLALIDVSDVRFKSGPLNIYTRYRNLKHLFKTREDKPIWQQYGIKAFLEKYIEATQLPTIAQNLLRYGVGRMEKLIVEKNKICT